MGGAPGGGVGRGEAEGGAGEEAAAVRLAGHLGWGGAGSRAAGDKSAGGAEGERGRGRVSTRRGFRSQNSLREGLARRRGDQWRVDAPPVTSRAHSFGLHKSSGVAFGVPREHEFVFRLCEIRVGSTKGTSCCDCVVDRFF